MVATTTEQSTSLRRRLVNGTLWNFLAAVCNQGSTFAVSVLVARVLGKQGFGEYAILQNTLATITFLIQLSMGFTATKFVAEYRSVDRDRTGRILGMCALVSGVMAVVGAVALAAGATVLAGQALHAPHLTAGLRVGALYLLFAAINAFQVGALIGLEATAEVATAGIASGLFTLVAVTAGVLRGQLLGAVCGLALAALVRCAIHHLLLHRAMRRQGLRFSFAQLGAERHILLQFALPAALAGYYSQPAIWLVNAMLVKQPGGFAQMALYGAATSVRQLVLFLPNVINTVGLSVLNHERGAGHGRQYYRVFRANILTILGVSLVVAGMLAIGAGWILALFGKDFHAGQPVVWWLLLSTIPESLSIALFQDLQSRGQIWQALFSINIPRETLFVVLAWRWIPHLGAVGVARAYLLVWIFALGIVAVMTLRQNPPIFFSLRAARTDPREPVLIAAAGGR